jgi:hypothetical protein
LAEVTINGGVRDPRRCAESSIINRAEPARSITAIGNPPIISIGTPNRARVSSVRVRLTATTIAAGSNNLRNGN